MVSRQQCPTCNSSIDDHNGRQLKSSACPDCASRERPPLGNLSHYQLIERLGSGAFGEVFAAIDLRTHGEVAFKISWRSLDESQANSLTSEASATAHLQHPYIAKAREVGRIGDRVYIASDLVHGTTLHAWRTSHKPGPLESIRVCEQLAEILQYAHTRGVVHRDLKPSNIMIDAESRPYLVDFGLAKDGRNQASEAIERYQAMRHVLSNASKRRSSLRIIGTPAYMSPEQAEGKAHTVDGRSDIYSLGVILYELLTGRRPFDGKPEQLARDIIHRQPVRPRRYNRGIPPAVEAICMKAMAKSPLDRYESAAEMAKDCKNAFEGKPIAWRLQRGLSPVWPIFVWKIVRA